MVPAKDENPVSDFKFDALTSLRGIAALCTVLAHLIVIWGDVFPPLQQGSLFRDFAVHTYLFVDFFFVLSGFVMSHAYGRHFADAVRAGSYMRFLRARFARVYPLHLLLLLVYVGLATIGIKQAQENPDWSITAHLLLLHAMGFFNHTTWNQPSWSISVEWWTYIVFPFAIPLARRYFSNTAAILALPVILGLFAFLAMHFGSANLTVGFAFFRCLIGFCAGACLYAIVQQRRMAAFADAAANGALAAVFLVLLFVPSPYADMLAFVAFARLCTRPAWEPAAATGCIIRSWSGSATSRIRSICGTACCCTCLQKPWVRPHERCHSSTTTRSCSSSPRSCCSKPPSCCWRT